MAILILEIFDIFRTIFPRDKSGSGPVSDIFLLLKDFSFKPEKK